MQQESSWPSPAPTPCPCRWFMEFQEVVGGNLEGFVVRTGQYDGFIALLSKPQSSEPRTQSRGGGGTDRCSVCLEMTVIKTGRGSHSARDREGQRSANNVDFLGGLKSHGNTPHKPQVLVNAHYYYYYCPRTPRGARSTPRAPFRRQRVSRSPRVATWGVYRIMAPWRPQVPLSPG